MSTRCPAAPATLALEGGGDGLDNDWAGVAGSTVGMMLSVGTLALFTGICSYYFFSWCYLGLRDSARRYISYSWQTMESRAIIPVENSFSCAESGFTRAVSKL